MRDILVLPKFTLIITTRCNLKCRLCCEYVPQNKPFPDMTLEQEKAILDAAFQVADRVETLHISGGGEPFLHPQLAEMIELAFEYADGFDRLMLFTNSLIPISDKLLMIMEHHTDKLVVHASDYGIAPKRTADIHRQLMEHNINLRIVKYYGEGQDFGGWVDFGGWEARNHSLEALERVFQNCAITRDMRGNWRTRNGKVHWCSRSQRGMELGFVPDNPAEYVDLLNSNMTREEKREGFRRIAGARFLSACDRCSGDQGTDDAAKRFAAAEQEGR